MQRGAITAERGTHLQTATTVCPPAPALPVPLHLQVRKSFCPFLQLADWQHAGT